MTPVDIQLTAPQLAEIAAQIGGVPDSYRAQKGIQLVCISAVRGSMTFQTVGIDPDNAIFENGMTQV